MIESWQIAILCIGTVSFIVDIAALSVCWINKNTFPPFKSKQLDVISLSVLVSMFWWISNSQATSVIPNTGIFADCRFWDILGISALGVNAFLTLITFRMYRLYYMMILMKVPTGLAFWSVVLGSYLPSFVFGIAPFFLPENAVITNTAPDYGCTFTSRWYLVLGFLLTLCQIAFLLYLNYRLATVRESMNEYQENHISLVCAVFFVLVAAALVLAGQAWYVHGLVIINLCNLLGPKVLVWAAIGKPLYGFYFRKKSYLEEFRLGLQTLKTSRLYLDSTQVVPDARTEMDLAGPSG
ncbi:hypothetical protein HDU91_005223 [Kappamyces sp. JEL0680]|nr:hypothetical protein HDU91_005223 [Kappamyces sp. JEL0680]